MPEIKKILYPVELSPISEKIVDHVAFWVEKFGAEVHVIHVVPNPTDYATPYFSEWILLKTKAELLQEAERQLAAFCDAHLPQAKVSVLMGDPVEEIVNYVRKNGISLVIMGTHGRKGLDRVVLGSVANRVVRRSPVPVVTINPFLLEAEQAQS
jgi:nucleotide-binding universal stress UspA family protein